MQPTSLRDSIVVSLNDLAYFKSFVTKLKMLFVKTLCQQKKPFL